MARRRLLIAHTLSGPTAGEVNGLRRALGSSEIDRIAPHVTLVPPLNTPGDLDEVLTHLRGVAARVAGFEVELGAARAFPPDGHVVYLGVSDPDAGFPALAEALATGPLAPPEGRDARAFVAHVTILNRASREVSAAAVGALRSFRAAVTVSSITLLEQDESAPSRRWHPISEVLLGPALSSGRGGIEVTITRFRFPPPEAVALFSGSADAPLSLVAYVGDQPVGALAAERAGKTLVVTRHVVSPDYQQSGIGTRLLDRLEAEAAEMGITEMLVVVPLATRAAQYYAGRGYEAGRYPAAAGAEVLVRRLRATRDDLGS